MIEPLAVRRAPGAEVGAVGQAPELTVVGISHRTASVAVRERWGAGPEALPALLLRLRGLPGVAGVVVLSTCNRFEAWLEGTQVDVASVAALLAGEAAGPEAPLETWSGAAAVRHLMRVAAGLDSMVPGDAQILGQVKSAFALAEEAQAAGPLLKAVLRAATSAARRVRTETAIGRRPVSVAHVALDLLAEAVHGLSGRRVLVVGSGKMATVAAKRLHELGARMVIAGRTPKNAEALARAVGGRGCGLDQLAAEMAAADAVVSCTGCPVVVIEAALVREVQARRGGRGLAIADLALPRDVDPAVATVPGVALLDLDSVQAEAEANLAERRAEAQRAETLLDEELGAFLARARERQATPLVVQLRERAEGIRQAELERARRRLGDISLEQSDALDALTRAIVNKLLHAPSVQLRALGAPGSPEASLVRTFFDLDA